MTLVNAGHRLDLHRGEIGKVSARRLNLLESGNINFDLEDLPQTDLFDAFEVTNDVIVGGGVQVTFADPFPPVGTHWPIIKADSVSGQFSRQEFIGLSRWRTAWIEYYDREVHVVIGGPEIIDHADLPDRFPWDTDYRIAHAPDDHLLLETSNPGVLRIQGNHIAGHGAGTATLRISIWNREGVLSVVEREITVEEPEPGQSAPDRDIFVARGDTADWLAENIDPGSELGSLRLDVDDDQDSIPRIWEYVHGGNPNQADPTAYSIEWSGLEPMEFSAPMAHRAAGRFDLRVERSRDGRFWTELPGRPNYTPSVEGGSVGVARWTLGVDQNLAGNPKRCFYRLRIIGFQPEGVAWAAEVESP